ncbi:Transposase family tnp2-domain-containing protein [Pyronema omphalodes]|nr:Transposase family tnp2-domain-containing protein [Pyronema omphalodes]
MAIMPDTEMPSPVIGEMPEMVQGEMPEMVQGEMPEMIQGEMPEMVQGEMPEMVEGEMPQMVEGEMPASREILPIEDIDMPDSEVDQEQESQGRMHSGYMSVHEEESPMSSSHSESDGDSVPDTSDFIDSQSNTQASARPDYYNSFDYEDLYGDQLTTKEILSLSLWDIYTRYHTPRRAEQEIKATLDALGYGPHDMRTTGKSVQERTGLKAIHYDCCPNSCMSFVSYPDINNCLICGHARWKQNSSHRVPEATRITTEGAGTTSHHRVPWAQHVYIPVTHRLRLGWANKDRALEMLQYRNSASLDRETGNRTDFWSSDFCDRLKSKGMLDKDTDIAFFLSMDGVRVFKSRRSFSIWPLLLINLNLPPKVRVKRSNMICVGFVPGPREPKNLDSFLAPLIEEFLQLGKGIDNVLNAARRYNVADAYFTMRAFIPIIGCDMVGRSKVMNTLGNRAYHYLINRNDLPLRTHEEFCRRAVHITRTMCLTCPRQHGIRGTAIVSRLPSIEFPTSFPPDLMHIMYENVIPALFRHYRGVFGVREPVPVPVTDGGHEHSSEGSEDDDEGARDSEPIRPTQPSKKFIRTSDSWNIAPPEWKAIGKAFEQSAQLLPHSFGEPLRDFYRHCQELKAAEWAAVTKHAGPVFLSTLLPECDYHGYMLLVKAIILLEQFKLTEVEINQIQNNILEFSEYYEKRFYGRRYANVRACLPSMHQLLHIPHFVQQLGPMFVYWQWPMERFCGMMTDTAKSRVSANANMANRLIIEEQKNLLPHVLPADIFLTSSLRTGREPIGPRRPHRDNNSHKTFEYLAPSRTHHFTEDERRHIIDYFRRVHGWTRNEAISLLPTQCDRWAALTVLEHINNDNFKVVASNMRRSNSTRSSSTPTLRK